MAVSIHPHWENILQDSFESPYFKTLIDFVKSAYGAARCFPPGKFIFNAFDLCPPEKTKVVILGQDPYHGPGQAHGLCFSVPAGIPHPPSLINIFKELQEDVQIPYPRSGDLSPWAKQGVLLLNATLTVQAHKAGSHQGKGWEKFSNRVTIWILRIQLCWQTKGYIRTIGFLGMTVYTGHYRYIYIVQCNFIRGRR